MKKMKTTATIHSSPAQPFDSKLSGASKGTSNTAGKKSMKLNYGKKKR